METGGKMITVDIRINGKLIESMSAVNVTERLELGKYGQGRQFYCFHEDLPLLAEQVPPLIQHYAEDGAVFLATKMLQTTIKRRKEEEDAPVRD